MTECLQMTFFRRAKACCALLTVHHIVEALDAAFQQSGIHRHPKKDENGKTSTTIIGIGLDGGGYLVPEKVKFQRLLVGICHLLTTHSELSGDALAAILGICAWFAALSRLMFS